MLFVEVAQMYTGVYLCNTILVMEILFVIDIQQLIILVRNNISQPNLTVASGNYCGLSV